MRSEVVPSSLVRRYDSAKPYDDEEELLDER